LSEATIGARDTPAVLQAVVDVAADVFGTRCGAILLPDALDALRVSASSPAGEPCPLTREEEGIADYVWRHQSRVPHGGALYTPVTLGAERLGVLRLGPRANGEALPHDDLRLLEAFARGAAAAIDRRRLLEAATQAEVLRRSDALKTALLGTVSHDLRTPLAALKTGITALLQGDVRWDRQAQLEILSASNDEVDRLTRLISNVLDLSRIEAGALVPDRQWYEIGELINDSVRRAGAGLEAHLVAVDIADGDLPMNVDYVQMQQVLANLLDNAAKYSPAGSRIRVTGGVEGAAYVIRVHDAGPGIPASEADRIFSKFYRLAGRRTGTGLGLAICKGLVDAHGGCIAVENPGRPGAVFAVSLPIAERPAMTPSAV
jgi:two-component system sensor histidine kinase KdpD